MPSCRGEGVYPLSGVKGTSLVTNWGLSRQTIPTLEGHTDSLDVEVRQQEEGWLGVWQQEEEPDDVEESDSAVVGGGLSWHIWETFHTATEASAI